MTRDRITKEELAEIIKATEDAGRDATDLKIALEEAFPPPTQSRGARGARNLQEEESTAEYLNRKVGYLFPDGVTGDILAQLIQIDYRYNLTELRAMCKDNGLSTRGDKKELAAKLLANGRL